MVYLVIVCGGVVVDLVWWLCCWDFGCSVFIVLVVVCLPLGWLVGGCYCLLMC